MSLAIVIVKAPFILISKSFATVFYSYQSKPLKLKIGPSLLLNTIAQDRFSLNEKGYKESKLSIGLFAGIGLHIWNGRRTYGLLNCDYIYSIPNKVGPFPANDFGNNDELLETNISFKHATASFTFGIHL